MHPYRGRDPIRVQLQTNKDEVFFVMMKMLLLMLKQPEATAAIAFSSAPRPLRRSRQGALPPGGPPPSAPRVSYHRGVPPLYGGRGPEILRCRVSGLVTSHGLHARNPPPPPAPVCARSDPEAQTTSDETRTSPSWCTRTRCCRASRRKAADPDTPSAAWGSPSLWAIRCLGHLGHVGGAAAKAADDP